MSCMTWESLIQFVSVCPRVSEGLSEGVSKGVSFRVCALPFIVQGRQLQGSRAPTGGSRNIVIKTYCTEQLMTSVDRDLLLVIVQISASPL
jgi:hypothetical protein